MNGEGGDPPEALRLQFRVPVEVIEPAIVQIVRREQPSVAVQVVHREPLRRLQGEQAVTTLSQEVMPPRERGMT